MTQPKEIPEQKIPPSARYRYWTSPPEFLTIKVADIESAIPKANWKAGGPADKVFELPASVVFGKNVPRISLHQLAELLPDHVLPSDGVIRLPVTRLAGVYHLVEHREELPPEKIPEVEIPEAPPEFFSETTPDGPVVLPEDPGFSSGAEGLPAGTASGEASFVEPLPAFLRIEKPAPSAPVPPAVSAPAVDGGLAAPPAPPVIPDAPAASVPSGKVPPRRTGRFVGLPFFRKKSTQPVSGSDEVSEAPFIATGIRLPQMRSAPSAVPVPPQDLVPVPVQEPFVEEPALAAVPDLPAEPAGADAGETVIAEPVPEPRVPPVFTMLQTETLSREVRGNEITEQESLQALFLTDENMTVDRVIELCGGLPGINSCVLAHGSVVVAAHNVPEGVDLVSMSAHAADMLRSMRESSARMGVGTVPAVTLHTEKGVISFFHRDDLTMLVFHKDRGFIPGVREKMAAVLGELTKARLTLPVGGES